MGLFLAISMHVAKPDYVVAIVIDIDDVRFF